ncbi:MAG: hypothetical protein JXQ29_00040 [Planctomycetes bacterium]|nr:hypothetical protein [Planctomycetota bacterium]
MDRHRLVAALMLMALAGGAAFAQVAGQDARAQEEEPAAGAAAKIQDVDPEGQPAWASLNYKLQVRLKNEQTLIGIVRDGQLFEKLVYQGEVSPFEKSLQQRYGLAPSVPLTQRFVKAAPTEAGVGIRLWHHDSTGGYVFLVYDDIVTVKRLQVISPAELKELDEQARQRNVARKEEIQKKWEEYARRRREELKRVPEAGAPAGAPGAKVEGPAGAPAGGEGAAEQEIFNRFHPAKGWTPGRKRVIEWRKWTLGVFPSEEEKEFLANFDPWKKAYDQWMSSYAEKESEKNPPIPDKPPVGK